MTKQHYNTALPSIESNNSSATNWNQSYYNVTPDVDDTFDASSTCLKLVYEHRDLTQLTSVTAILVVLYVIVSVTALLGNLLVIWTVWRNNHMHTVTNYYIVNLAISDLLVAALVMPLKLLEYTADCSWLVFRSDALCSVVYYLLPIFVFTSVLTLVAISIERYYAIVHPLSAMKFNSKSRTRKILAVTWVVPIIVASPYVFCRSFAFTIYSDYGIISRQICSDRFNEIDTAMYGDDVNKQGSFRKAYFLFLFCVIYLLPSIVILTTCIKIAISLLQPITVESSPLGRKDTSRRHEENKRKVARMVVVIAIAFILSWSPQYLVSVISQLQEVSFLQKSNYFFTMLVTHLFGFVNSCLNPIIYTAMSQKFRRSFRDIIRSILCCCTFSSSAPYTARYLGSSHRCTSTQRQTMSETEGQQLPLTDSPRDRGNHSSSSGAESESRALSDRKTIMKYVFKANNSNANAKRTEDHSSSPYTSETSFTELHPRKQVKGILKKTLFTAKPAATSTRCVEGGTKCDNGLVSMTNGNAALGRSYQSNGGDSKEHVSDSNCCGDRTGKPPCIVCEPNGSYKVVYKVS